MIKLEFDFGIGETAEGLPLDPATAVLGKGALMRFVTDIVGGCSLIPRVGAWRDPDTGRYVEEQGYTLVAFAAPEVFEGEIFLVENIANFIKTTFQQKSVLVARSQVWGQLI